MCVAVVCACVDVSAHKVRLYVRRSLLNADVSPAPPPASVRCMGRRVWQTMWMMITGELLQSRNSSSRDARRREVAAVLLLAAAGAGPAAVGRRRAAAMEAGEESPRRKSLPVRGREAVVR